MVLDEATMPERARDQPNLRPKDFFQRVDFLKYVVQWIVCVCIYMYNFKQFENNFYIFVMVPDWEAF